MPYVARPKNPDGFLDDLFNPNFEEPLSSPQVGEELPENLEHPRRPYVAGAGFNRVSKSAITAALLAAANPDGSYDDFDLAPTSDNFLQFIRDEPVYLSPFRGRCSIDRVCQVIRRVEPLYAPHYMEAEVDLFRSFLCEEQSLVRMRLATLLTVLYIRMGFREEGFKLMCYLHRVGVLMSVGLRLAPVQEECVPSGLVRADLEYAWQFVLGVVGSIRVRFGATAMSTPLEFAVPSERNDRSPSLAVFPSRVFGEGTSLVHYEAQLRSVRELNEQYSRVQGTGAKHVLVLQNVCRSFYTDEAWAEARSSLPKTDTSRERSYMVLGGMRVYDDDPDKHQMLMLYGAQFGVSCR